MLDKASQRDTLNCEAYIQQKLTLSALMSARLLRLTSNCTHSGLFPWHASTSGVVPFCKLHGEQRAAVEVQFGKACMIR